MAITATTELKTEYGLFKVNYHRTGHHKCVTFVFGDIQNTIPIVRIHSACLFGEAFHSLHCDCRFQLQTTMSHIINHGSGVIAYAFDEGRGIGLEKKIMAMNIQQKQHCDTVEAFKRIGLDYPDYRTYQAEITALIDLKLNPSIYLVTGNPNKVIAIQKAGFIIKSLIHLNSNNLSKEAKAEKQVKIEKLGYDYPKEKSPKREPFNFF